MDQTIKPKVSIQMCTYNRGIFIRDAIESVFAQTFQDWELLILDDASTDNTKAVILPYLSDTRVRYERNEINLGITKNRNHGLSISRGEYIAVLDSDDYWIHPAKLERQVAFLDTHPDYALVGTDMDIVSENKKLIKHITYPKEYSTLVSQMLLKNNFSHSSVLYRKNLILGQNGYNEEIPIWEDYDLWLDLAKKYKVANLNMTAVAYRRHGKQSNSNKKRETLKVLGQIIETHKKDYKFYILARIINFFRLLRS